MLSHSVALIPSLSSSLSLPVCECEFVNLISKLTHNPGKSSTCTYIMTSTTAITSCLFVSVSLFLSLSHFLSLCSNIIKRFHTERQIQQAKRVREASGTLLFMLLLLIETIFSLDSCRRRAQLQDEAINLLNGWHKANNFQSTFTHTYAHTRS